MNNPEYSCKTNQVCRSIISNMHFNLIEIKTEKISEKDKQKMFTSSNQSVRRKCMEDSCKNNKFHCDVIKFSHFPCFHSNIFPESPPPETIFFFRVDYSVWKFLYLSWIFNFVRCGAFFKSTKHTYILLTNKIKI